MYRKFDRVLGKALKSIDPDVPVLVMSDHGFGPFRREVNVNNWLAQEGYLKLSAGRGRPRRSRSWNTPTGRPPRPTPWA